MCCFFQGVELAEGESVTKGVTLSSITQDGLSGGDAACHFMVDIKPTPCRKLGLLGLICEMAKSFLKFIQALLCYLSR